MFMFTKLAHVQNAVKTKSAFNELLKQTCIIDKGVQGAHPQDSFLNFTPSRRQETASPVLKTDSVDTVFTFYYARKMLTATLNRTFRAVLLRAVLHIQQPFYFISFIYLF